MRTLMASFAALVLAPGLAGAKEGFLPWQNPAAVSTGAALYAEHCAACHGAELEGQVPEWRERDAAGMMPAPPHDETGHTWHHPDTLLFKITKYGTAAVVGGGYRSAMAGFGDVLSDADILAVLAYIKSTWPARVQAMHDRVNAGG